MEFLEVGYGKGTPVGVGAAIMWTADNQVNA